MLSAEVDDILQDLHNYFHLSKAEFNNCYESFTVQSVPKVRSSNFMRHKFWSKQLYCYMKFVEDVYFSIEYMYSEFQ